MHVIYGHREHGPAAGSNIGCDGKPFVNPFLTTMLLKKHRFSGNIASQDAIMQRLPCGASRSGGQNHFVNLY
jgi:hypothetical protein